MKLTPGDYVIAFSDGVTEALNERGDEYTDDRLLAAVQANLFDRQCTASTRARKVVSADRLTQTAH